MLSPGRSPSPVWAPFGASLPSYVVLAGCLDDLPSPLEPGPQDEAVAGFDGVGCATGVTRGLRALARKYKGCLFGGSLFVRTHYSDRCDGLPELALDLGVDLAPAVVARDPYRVAYSL